MYDDNDKISIFCADKIKQNQIDEQRNQVPYKRVKHKAKIPFAKELNDANNCRRTVTQEIYRDESYEKVDYCEHNYTSNMKMQILKVVREKSQQMKCRNIGFGFIFFNNEGN